MIDIIWAYAEIYNALPDKARVSNWRNIMKGIFCIAVGLAMLFGGGEILVLPASAATLPAGASQNFSTATSQQNLVQQIADNRGRRVRPGNRLGGKPGFNKPGFNKPGFGKPGFNKPGFGRPGFNRPGFRPGLRPGFDNRPAWRRPSYYRWRPGGAIAAGAAIGFLAAAAAAWAGPPPMPGYCWYYTDASRRRGFWDQCP